MNSINVSVDPKHDWKPWKISAPDGEQIAGFLTRYETEPGMFFVTVKGAGHMVPQWKPQAAYELLHRFLHGNKGDMVGGVGDKGAAIGRGAAGAASPAVSVV